MKIKQVVKDDIMVLELSGKIMGGPDHDKFKGEITEILEKDFKKIILDLDGVPWINSTGLGILISGFTSIKNADGRMRICNVKDRVRSIFYMSQLENVFEVHTSMDETMASF